MNLKAPTISIRDNRDNQVGVLYDYFNDSIELFLEGKVSILTLSVLDENNYRELLVNGNSLSFTYKSEDYHMTIVKSDEDEDVITITAWSLVLELNNETKAPFSGTSLTFAQYLNAFDGEKILTLNINEVSDKKISHKFDSQQTMLERLFSLAKLFNAEIEFKTILADNGSLEKLEINVYKAHDQKNQGLGEDKSSQVFYFGKEINTVKKTSDIMNLFTAIRPVGKDGLNLKNYTAEDVKDDKGETLYYLKNGMIYAPKARELYPSNLINKADRWTVYDWSTEYTSQATLYGNALAKLRDELSKPAVTWTIEGFIDAKIGDTISVHDNGYKPTLLLEARIISQRISMTNPSSNETTFSNIEQVQSEISAELIAKMNELIKENVQYTTSLITTNGTSFKNGEGSTVLKAKVFSSGKEVTNDLTVRWYKNEKFVTTAYELEVKASEIEEKAVFRFDVIDTYGNLKNATEVTVFNVNDGAKGEKGDPGAKGNDGVAGKDGVGLKETIIRYASSSNGEVAPTSGWQSTVPFVSPGDFLWTRTIWVYTDSTSEVGYSVSRIGADGNDGEDGIAGKDGTGIKSTTITYVGSTNGTTPPSTGWTSTIPTVADGNYLWTKMVWLYTDNTSETGYSVAKMGEKGSSGKDGIAGKDGVGIKNTTITYAQNTSGTTAPTSGWATNVPTLIKGQYLWTKTVWAYTDDTSETGYTVSYNAKDGNNGTDGIAGKDGVGIKNTTIQYVGSTSGTTRPTSGWSTTIPAVPEGNFLWTRTTWTYTDNTSEMGYSVAKMGAKGADGIAGKDGVGIKNTTIQYASSTSGTTAPTTGWQTSVPTVAAGNYLWTKNTWTYTDNTTEVGYAVSRIGKDGNNGTDGIAGKDGVGIKATSIQYAGSTNGATPPTTGWTASVPTVASGSYLWTKTTWSYTDDTSETGYSVSKMGETGAKGDSATSYWITPSVNTIQISATKVLSPTTVTFTGYSKTGTANAGLYAGRFNILTSVDGITYSSKYSSSANQSAYTYTVPANVKFIKARMYQAGSTSVLVDEVTIPIIESAEGLEIGNRNYFSVKAWNTKPALTINGIPYMDIKLEPNTQYTLSTNIPSRDTLRDVFFLKGTDTPSSLVNGVAKDLPMTLTTNADGIVKVAIRDYNSNEYWIMLAKGNKAIDWQPALEDAVTYQRWSNDPNGLVDMTDTYPNENLFVGSVSEYRNVGVGVWNGGMGFTSLLEDIGVKVGDNITLSAYFKNPTTAPDSVSARINFIKADGTYTSNSGNYIKPGEEGRSILSVTLPAGIVEIACLIQRTGGSATAPTFTTQIMKEKLEVGSVATIWTSNQQEDKLLAVPQYVGVGVQNTMNPSDFTWNISPEYTQALTDLGLKDKVDNGSYENDKSDIWEEIGNRVTEEEARDIRQLAESLKNSYEAFISEGGQYQADLEALDARSALLVQNLGDKLATYNFLDTHIKLGEEGLLIGAKGDPMKMLLSKDKLSFTDGGEVVAYFSKQSFYINRGAIVDSLQVGQHKIVKLNTNHTIFQWITG